MPCQARCRGCGYSLHGLPEPKCPECGREFDPGNPATFVVETPSTRRRRWIKRGAKVACLLAAIFLLCPRGLMRATITLTCVNCGEQTIFERAELRPPRWIPFHYPGLSRRRDLPPAQPVANCTKVYNVAVASDLFIGGFVRGTGTMAPGGDFVINDSDLTFDSAPTIAAELLSRDQQRPRPRPG